LQNRAENARCGQLHRYGHRQYCYEEQELIHLPGCCLQFPAQSACTAARTVNNPQPWLLFHLWLFSHEIASEKGKALHLLATTLIILRIGLTSRLTFHKNHTFPHRRRCLARYHVTMILAAVIMTLANSPPKLCETICPFILLSFGQLVAVLAPYLPIPRIS
jgi:hypothetical protein